jgi:hypothetical protein
MSESLKKFQGRFIVFLLPILLAGTTMAQSTRGELAGSVADSTGATIPNASVSATNQATGGQNVTVSTSAGSYRFPDLPIGIYSVKVTAPGFSAANNTGIEISVNRTTSLNVTLTAGSVTDTVTVDASGARIETESSDLGGTVTAEQIVDLPLALGGVSQFRSAENFVFLVPGTTGPGAGGAQGLNGNGVFYGKISGGQDYGAEVLLDGASITRSENGSSFDETSPSVEAMQEFKVTTSTPTAEFGRTTAGFESFVTKGGGNKYHGTAFDLNVNTVYNANGWFQGGLIAQCQGDAACIQPLKRTANNKNDYGGTLGGPVVIPHLYNGKDKTFFFFAWEQFRQTLGGIAQSTLPTAAEQKGDFSAILGAPVVVNGITQQNPCTGAPLLQNQIFDPSTTNSTISATNPTGIPCRLPFANNVVPTTAFSKAAQALVAGLPTPNATGIPNGIEGGQRNNYVVQQGYPLRNTTETIRVDQTLGAKSKIFASYSSRDNVRQGVNNLPLPFSNFTPQNFVTHYSRAGWDYTFTPNLLNHLNLGYNRTNSFNYAQTLGGSNFAAQAGIANVVAAAYPIINFDGNDAFTSLGDGSNGDNVDNGIRINDSVNWVHGRHSVKFGIDLRHQAYATVQRSIPTFNFERGETSAYHNSNAGFTGNSFASLLLGLPDSTTQNAYIHSPRWLSHYIAGFVEDDVKVSKALTLNLGLRYDVDSPRHEAGNNTSNFSLTAPDANANGLPGALIFGATCKCNSAWADTYYKDIAPRLGFAYVLPGTDGKAVLRGGGALIYGPLLYGDFGGSMTQGYTVQSNAFSTDQGFSPAYQLDKGFPNAFPTAPNLNPAQVDNGQYPSVGGEFISPGMGRPSVTYNWSLQLQREVAKNLIATIGYIGQEAQNLRSALQNINNIPLSDFSYGDHLNQDNVSAGHPADGVNAPYPTFNHPLYFALRPLPQYDFIATDCCLQNVGHSSYHALVTSLNQSTRFGLSFQASYTWQRNLTDADSALENNQPNLQQDQNIFNHRLEKSVSVQNIPNTFVVNYIYSLPFGKGKAFLNKGALVNVLVGGWKIGGIQRYQSGQPISFGCATGIPGYQNCIRFSKGPAQYESAAYRQNKLGPSQFNGQSWFNPAYCPGDGSQCPNGKTVALQNSAFVDYNDERKGFRPLNGCLVNGNFTCSYAPFALGQGIDRVTSNVSTPLWLSEDFSLIKDFQIHEGLSFQLKLEALDAFNRHNFNIPDLEPNDANFGVPTFGSQNMGPRNMQVTGRINF